MTINKHFRTSLWICALSLVCFQVGCSTGRTNRQVADEEVARFHDKLNKELYESIVFNGSEEFRTPGLAMAGYLKKVHEVAGEVQGTQLLTSNAQNAGSAALITMYYRTTFGQGKGNETFVWRVEDGRARLISYDLKGFYELNRD